MYEYLVAGFANRLRSEIEFFFNKPSWAVADIPDPNDPDPEQYAVLAVLTFYIATAFNRLIERGLPRDSPFIISTAMEDELKGRPVVLEKEPNWIASVQKLEGTLIIPNVAGHIPEEESRSSRFRELNIIAEEPHVLFV